MEVTNRRQHKGELNLLNLPRELLVTRILPHAVGPGFLPGMMGASKAARGLAADTFEYLESQRHLETVRAARRSFALAPAPTPTSSVDRYVEGFGQRAREGGGPTAQSLRERVANAVIDRVDHPTPRYSEWLHENWEEACGHINRLFTDSDPVREISLGWSGLPAYPPRLFISANLVALWLPGNSLTTLPDVGALPHLKILDLHHNRLSDLGHGLAARFPALTYLDLNDNPTASGPGRNWQELLTLSNLQFLGVDEAFVEEHRSGSEKFHALRLLCMGVDWDDQDISLVSLQGDVLVAEDISEARPAYYSAQYLDAFRASVEADEAPQASNLMPAGLLRVCLQMRDMFADCGVDCRGADEFFRWELQQFASIL